MTNKLLLTKNILKTRRKTFLLLALLFTGGMASAQVQINGNVFGGGNLGQVSDSTTVTVNGGTIGRKLTLDERMNDANGQVIHVDYGNVYGGGNGYKIDGYRRINKDDGYGVWPLDVPIINPNYGLVKGNTNVTISGHAVVRRAVYGGGNMATVGNAEIPQSTGIADYTSGGKATVTIKGNALIGPTKDDLTKDDAGNTLSQADIDRNFKYLGANEGFVFGASRGLSGDALKHLSFADSTIVTITGYAQVVGHVFGGGENGHVQKGTNVIINDHAVIGGVPLHGDSTGFAANTQMAYPISDGEYSGVTVYLNKEEGELNEDEFGVGQRVFRGNVFGGGKGTDFISWWKEQHNFNKYCYTAGRVYGNTNVTIAGNAQVYNRVYGGGTIASVGTFKYEDESNANAITDLFSGGTCNVTINGGTIGSPGSDGKNCGEVFGGGRGLPGRPRNGTESFMTIHQLPDEAYAGNTYVTVTGGTIMNSVYGGPANGHVQGDARVTITAGTIGSATTHGWHGNVFGGGGGTMHYKEDGQEPQLSITAGRVFGDTYVNISDGKVYHNVYGGGAIASVGTYNASNLTNPTHPYLGHGHATVTITGGEIGSDGNENGMVFGSGRGEIAEPGNFLDYVTYVAYSEVNIGTNGATSNVSPKIKGSVYGSGENGHVYLESKVNVFAGTIGCTLDEYEHMTAEQKAKFPYRGNVYGAGCGTDEYGWDTLKIPGTQTPATYPETTDPIKIGKYNPLAGVTQGNTKVNIYGGYISRSVYGGGAMASVGLYSVADTLTDPATEFALSWPYKFEYTTIEDAAYNAVPTGKTEINIYGGHIGTYKEDDLYALANSGDVYGGSRGMAGDRYGFVPFANVKETVVKIAYSNPATSPSANGNFIVNSVFGGGENGHVYKDTKVTIDDGFIGGSVFGGGKGRDEYWDFLKSYSGGVVSTNLEKVHSITAGKVFGNTEVTINDGVVQHNVFGGGEYASVGIGNYFGYGELTTDQAAIALTTTTGKTTVKVNGGTIGTLGYPDEYGIGNGFVYGSSKGITFPNVDQPANTPRYDYSRDFFLGYTNETVVTIGDPDPTSTLTPPTIKGSVFGGGEDGHVRFNTDVTVKQGTIGVAYTVPDSYPEPEADSLKKWVYRGNVYGAGRGIDKIASGLPHAGEFCSSAGSVTLNTNVTIEGGRIHRNVYGGGSNASVGPPPTGYNPGPSKCTVNIKGGTIGEVKTVTPTDPEEEPYTLLYGGDIFGGSRGARDLVATANIGRFASVSQTEVNIDSLRNGSTWVCSADVIGNVYGGGEIGQTKINAVVNMGYGNVAGSVYGGGKGELTDEKAALVLGNATVNMTNGTVERSVYGGGQLGNVGTYIDPEHPTSADPNLPYYNATEIQGTAHVLGEPKGCKDGTGLATVKVSGGNVGRLGSLMPGPNSNPDDDDRGWIFCGGRGDADTIANNNPEYHPVTNPYATFINKSNLLGIVGSTYLEISNTDDTKPVISASVYGGCENGLVLGNTHVRIIGGQIGTGYNGGTPNPFDLPYSEQLWTDAIDAVNGGNPATINSIAAQFHECHAFPYGDGNGNYYVYDVFADTDEYPDYESHGGSTQGSNGHTFFGNVFGGGSGYYPIAPGIWRRSAGRVWGDTWVEITGGHVLTNVYGGNEITDVKGKCKVEMSGGTVGMPRTLAQIEAMPVVGIIFGGSMGDPRRAFDHWSNVKETEVTVTGGTVFSSIFGGSAVGHVMEDAVVSVSQAEGKATLIGTWGYSGLDGNVFGGGKGDECNIDPVPAVPASPGPPATPAIPAHPSFTPGRVGGNATLTMSSGKVLGNVYGGGFSALTGVGENGGFDSFITNNVYNGDDHGKTTVSISGGTIGNAANDEGLTLLRSANKVGNVYGGGSGNPNEYREDDLGRAANAVVSISGSPTILGSVFGGGQMANVGHWNSYDAWYTTGTGLTSVTIQGTPTIGTALEFDHDNYASLTPPPTYTVFDTINGVRMISHTRTGNVFGGGQGDVIVDSDGWVVGLEQGHCRQTYVNINMTNGENGGRIRGSVFGGSEDGAVWGDTEVHIAGGTVGTQSITSDSLVLNGTTWSVKPNHATYSFGSVFGGSYGKDFYRNFKVSDLSNTNTGQAIDSVNYLAGHVYGDTYVYIEGGAVRCNVFGGGNMASVGSRKKIMSGNTLVDVVPAPFDETATSGHLSQIFGNTTVIVSGGEIGPLDYTGLNAYVFGGGKGFSYDPDGLRKAYSNVDSTSVTVSGGKIWGSVFGGGSDSHVLGSASVTVTQNATAGTRADIGTNGLTTWDGNIFGGGRNFLNSNHTNGRVAGNITIDMDCGTIQGSIFGGGRMALTGVDMLGNPYVTDHVYDSAANGKAIHGLVTINVSGNTTGSGNNITYLTSIGNPDGNALLTGSDESVGDIFGSGKGDTKAYEDVLAGRVANTKINISGSPRIYGSVFGGGEMAGIGYWYTEDGKAKFYDKSGTAEVTIGETSSDNPVIGTETEYTTTYANTNPEWTVYDPDGKLIHTCTGNVFGGSQGDVDPESPAWVSMGRSRKSKVVVNGGTIKSCVYGGAEQGTVATDTRVIINGGTIGSWVTPDASASLDPYFFGGVYGGGYGSHREDYNGTTYQGHAITNDSTNYLSNNLWTANHLAGRVYGNTRVDVLGGTIRGDVYGGANYAYVGGYSPNAKGNTLVNIGSHSTRTDVYEGEATFKGSVYGANNHAGTPYGNVEVHVYQTAHTAANECPEIPEGYNEAQVLAWLATLPFGDEKFAIKSVFGGSNRADYIPFENKNALVHVYRCEENTIKDLYGGCNEASVGSPDSTYKTNAELIIDGGRFHRVFGGGNGTQEIAANITGTATTTINGGLIGERFGGSSTNGTIGEIVENINYNTDCQVVIVDNFGGGNESVQVGEIVHTIECNLENPSMFGNYYGGSRLAPIFGNVTLNVYGGTIGNLFGGSKGTEEQAADIKRFPATMEEANALPEEYRQPVVDYLTAHPDSLGHGGNVTVNIFGGTITNVYGGSNINGAIEGKIRVNVVELGGDCPLDLLTLYGGGCNTDYTPDYTIAENQKRMTPEVNLINGTVRGSIFGGGEGPAATVTANPVVNIGYEASKMASIVNGLKTAGLIPQTFNPDNAHAIAESSVFGGGDLAQVVGSTSVNIAKANTEVKGSVYGGGHGDSSDPSYVDYGRVIGNDTVRISDGQLGYYAWNEWIEEWVATGGNVFGGGELGSVTGDTWVEVSGGWMVKNLFGGGMGSPYGDGPQYGHVGGNTYVMVSGNAQIDHNVYGGGQMGSVGTGALADVTTGVAHVTISGGRKGDDMNTNVFGGGMGQKTAKTYANVDSTSVIVCDSAFIAGSVYGGSENGHVLAGTRVLIEKGTNTRNKLPEIGADAFNGDGCVFGGGLGTAGYYSAGRVGGNTTVEFKAGTVKGSIYGGGKLALTGVDEDGEPSFMTQVQVGEEPPVTVYDSINHGLATIRIEGTATTVGDNTVYSTVLGITDGYDLLSSDYSIGDIFGGGRGDWENYEDILAGRVANTDITISGSPRIYCSVFGGGEIAGVGYWDTDDENDIPDGKFVPKTGTTKVTVGGTPTIGLDYEFRDDGYRLHPVEWTMFDTINNVRRLFHTCSGNIFGASQGDAAVTDSPSWVSLGRSRMAYVEIKDNPTIMSSVFGGAEQGTVTEDTHVHISGGTIGQQNLIADSLKLNNSNEWEPYATSLYSYGNVFGGGFGVDSLQVQTNDSINYPTANSHPELIANVIAGRVYGNTCVDITGGTIRGNVFGGGNMASVGRWTDVLDEETGSLIDFAPVANTGNATVNVSGSAIIGPMDGTGLNAYVFGGGRGIGKDPDLVNNRNKYCNVNSTRVTIGLTFEGENPTHDDPEDDWNSATDGRIYGSVYGGGSDCHVLGDTYVFLNSGIIGTYDEDNNTITAYGGNIFGSGRNFQKVNYAAGRVAGNTNIEMNGGYVYGAIFGGGRHAVTGTGLDGMTMREDDATGEHGKTTVKVKGGTVGYEPLVTTFIDRPIGEVYGGGKGSMEGISLPNHPAASPLLIALVKSTNVEISQADLDVPTRILNAVYGGGEVGNVGHFTWDPGTVTSIALRENTGKTNVTIKGGTIGVRRMVMSYELKPGTFLPATNPVGNVFGGGKGISDDPSHYAANISTSPFGDKNLLDLMATVGYTTVVVENDGTKKPWVKGSVYGGSANGHVLHDTDVTIAGGQIGAGNDEDADEDIDPYDDDQFVDASSVNLDLPANSDKLLKGTYHWDYDPATLRPFDLVAIYNGQNSGAPVNDYKPTDGKTWFGNVFGGGSGFLPYIKNEGTDDEPDYKAYWNRESGKVYGNTRVEITGGHILSSVYGGCETADVGLYEYDNTIHGDVHNTSLTGYAENGTAKVIMKGGTVGVPRTTQQIKDHPVPGYVYGSGKGDPRIYFNTWTNVWQTYDTISGGKIYGGVFGSGEDGHVLGDVAVEVSEEDDNTIIGSTGLSRGDGNIFGGGRGTTAEALTAGSVGGNVDVSVKGGTMLGSVFGGGNLASVGIYLVDVQYDNSGTMVDNPYYGKFREDETGSNAKTYGHVTVNISGGYVGNDNETPTQADPSSIGGHVFGGSRGQLSMTSPIWPSLSRVKETDVTITGEAEIKACVYGGGQVGIVRDNATVTVSGGSVGRHYGTEGESDHFHYGSVFGGGYGTKELTGVTNDSTANGLYKLPMELAGRVYGNTFVTISGGQVWENVYGGGEMASIGMVKNNTMVKGATTVIVSGGQVGPLDMTALNGYVFGGGKGLPAYTYKDLGMVNSTHVMMQGSARVYGSLFGGGQDGHVIGNTVVDMDFDPTTGILGTTGETSWDGNIFGGGRNYQAAHQATGRVGGNVTVNVKRGKMFGSVFGGGRLGSVGVNGLDGDDFAMLDGTDHGYITVNIGGEDADGQTGNIIIGHTDNSTNGRTGGNVYGGGKGIAGAPSSIYPQLAKAKQTTVNVKERSGYQTWIKGSVFGSGEDGHVMEDTYVNVYGGQIGGTEYNPSNPQMCIDKYHGNVYGGGRGLDTYTGSDGQQHYSETAGKVYGNTNVNVEGGRIVHHVYGGGNISSVGDPDETPQSNGTYLTGKATVTIKGGEIGVDGNENGHVFGSSHGKAGERFANLAFVKNTEVYVTETDNTSPIIHGSVFGSGEDGHVRMNTHVVVDGGIIGTTGQTGYEGNVYGGGRGIDEDEITHQLSPTAGLVLGNTKVEIKRGATVKGSVFGGGRLASVGEENVETSGLAEVIIGEGSGTDQATIGTFNTGHTQIIYGGHVYGGGKGFAGKQYRDLTFVKNTEVTIKDGARIHGSVFGGGEDGHVRRTTLVTIDGGTIGDDEATCENTFHGNVYGAGRGIDKVNGQYSPTAGKVNWGTTVNINGGHIYRNVYGGGNMASVGMVELYASGENQGDPIVYSFGLNPLDKQGHPKYNADGTLNPAFVESDITGLARVNITNGTIGSDSDSDDKHGNVFGSSHGEAGTAYQHLAYVHDAKVVVGTDGGTGDLPLVKGSVFGGGQEGHVNMNACVVVNSGKVGEKTDDAWKGNVYGGGRGLEPENNSQISPTAGLVKGHTRVYMNGGTVSRSIYGGGHTATVNEERVVNINGGTVKGNVFGGGNTAPDATTYYASLKTVNVRGGHIEGSVYGCSYDAKEKTAPDEWPNTDKNNYWTSFVNITGGTIDNNVYAAGYGGIVDGSVCVNVGLTAVQSAPTYANNSSGNEQVNTFRYDGLPSNSTGTRDKLIIGGNIFGGSYQYENSNNEIWQYIPDITGYSTLFIDGDGYDTELDETANAAAIVGDETHPHYMNIGGGIYGSGSFCESGAKGRDILLRNYGTRNPTTNTPTAEFTEASRTLTTIQRGSFVVLDNTNIHLVGASSINQEFEDRNFGVLEIDSSLYVTNGTGIVLGDVATVAYMDSIHQVTSLCLKDNVNVYDQIMGRGDAGNWEVVGIRENDNLLYRIHSTGTPYSVLSTAQENAIIFKGDSKLWVRYSNLADNKRYYGQLLGFFRMRAEAYSIESRTSFAYARPKLTPYVNPLADYPTGTPTNPLDTWNKGDGGFLSYNTTLNTFTKQNQVVLGFRYPEDGNDGGDLYTKTKQYPYFNLSKVTRSDNDDVDVEDYRLWALPPVLGNKWYVDGRGIGNGGWGKDESHENGWGEFPDKPKLTVSGANGIYNDPKPSVTQPVFNPAIDIVFVVGPVDAMKENKELNLTLADTDKTNNYPLLLYRYPGGHKMSKGGIDDGTGQAPTNEATWNGVASGTKGPGTNYGAMINANWTKSDPNPDTFVMDSVVVDGLFEYEDTEISALGIPENYGETWKYGVSKPLVVTTPSSKLTLKGGTTLKRGYNNTDAAATWYNDADYSSYVVLSDETEVATHHGGALFVDKEATVNVSDSVLITGNKQRRLVSVNNTPTDRPVECNVYLPTFDKCLNISGTENLYTNTRIGITSPKRNTAASYKDNTFSPIAVASTPAIASNAWNNGNFLDDQDWFFGRNDKKVYYYSDEGTSLNTSTLYFGWTWANVVREAPSGFAYGDINSAEDLAWLISKSTGMNDQTAIDFSSVGTIKQTADFDMKQYVWVPIGTESKPFAGTYDGQGHLIKNLSVEFLSQHDARYQRKHYGMFGNVNNGKVKRTFVVSGLMNPESVPVNTRESQPYIIGGLVGHMTGSLAEVTASEAAVEIICPNYSFAKDVIAGGLVGQMEGGTLHSSMAMPFMNVGSNTEGYVGGLVGESSSGGIYNSFANAQFGINSSNSSNNNAKTKAGGLVGHNAGAELHNSYANLRKGSSQGSWEINATNFGGIVAKNEADASAIDSCYVMQDPADVSYNLFLEGSVHSSCGKYAPVISADNLGYMYADNKVVRTVVTSGETTTVTDTTMFVRLNKWVRYHNRTGRDYAYWARPGIQEINGDLPVLLLSENDDDATANHQGGFRSLGTYAGSHVLQYGGPARDGHEVDSALLRKQVGTSKDNLFVYGDVVNAISLSGKVITQNKVSIYEQASIKSPGDLAGFANTYVGVTFDNSFGHAYSTPGMNGLGGSLLPRDWHMFSTPLTAAPQGFNYQGTNAPEDDYDDFDGIPYSNAGHYNNPWVATTYEFSWLNGGDQQSGNGRYWMKDYNVADGYFPTNRGELYSDPSDMSQPNPAEIGHLFISGSDEHPAESNIYRYPYGMDFYTWYEPDYHWINFKRNGPNHWHSDKNSEGQHLHINYDGGGENINEETLITGRGYLAAISIPTFMQSHGSLNTGGNSILLTKAGSRCTGWNLVGNPYHGYLDFAAFANANQANLVKQGNSPFYVVYDADAYVQGQMGSGFLYYPEGGSVGGEYASPYLHPHQGFFVLAQKAESLTFDESMIVPRSTVKADSAFREMQPKYPLVNLYLTSDNGCKDVTVIEFERPEWGGATKLRELRQGNGLFYGYHDENRYAALFTKIGTPRVPLWFEAHEDDIFTMKWNIANGDFNSMYLIDNITGVQYDMLRNDTYRFEGHKKDYYSRFYIVFDVTGVDEEVVDDNFVFFDGSQWVVTGDGDLDFIDMQGRTLWNDHISGQQRVSLPNVAEGIYLFRLVNSNFVRIQKVVVKR